MINFKQACSADAEIWTKLNREFMSFELTDEDIWSSPDQVDDQVFYADFQRHLDNPDMGRLIIICEDDQPIGFITILFILSVWAHGKAMIIDDLFIREQYRGRGYGGEALRFCEEMAQRRGCKRLQLMAEDSNENAGEFYYANGYTGDGMTMFLKYFK